MALDSIVMKVIVEGQWGGGGGDKVYLRILDGCVLPQEGEPIYFSPK